MAPSTTLQALTLAHYTLTRYAGFVVKCFGAYDERDVADWPYRHRMARHACALAAEVVQCADTDQPITAYVALQLVTSWLATNP